MIIIPEVITNIYNNNNNIINVNTPIEMFSIKNVYIVDIHYSHRQYCEYYLL